MLGKKSMLIVLLSSILLATNTPSANANHVYREGTKEENQLILNYNKQINNQSKYIKYLNSLNQSLKQEEIERERLEKIKQKEQKKKDVESNNEWITVKVSYYTNSISDCQKTDAISASGKKLNNSGNYIAAPDNIPFGTKLDIQGLGIYEVVDRGGAIINDSNGVMHLDVFVVNATEEKLNSMGTHITKARIIK